MTLPRIVLLLVGALVLTLIVAQLSPAGDLGQNMALLVGLLMCAALVAPGVLGWYRGNLGEAARNLLIWGIMIAIVALAYANKSSFGF